MLSFVCSVNSSASSLRDRRRTRPAVADCSERIRSQTLAQLFRVCVRIVPTRPIQKLLAPGGCCARKLQKGSHAIQLRFELALEGAIARWAGVDIAALRPQLTVLHGQVAPADDAVAP